MSSIKDQEWKQEDIACLLLALFSAVIKKAKSLVKVTLLFMFLYVDLLDANHEHTAHLVEGK